VIEFTFTHVIFGEWSVAVSAERGMTAVQAFGKATEQYRSLVFPHYVPGHPAVTVRIKEIR
jgi:hypothetical protein